MKRIIVSGGFDPIHVGHVRLIQDAAKYGDKLIVIMNNDNWLRKKKGKEFMPENERKEILENIRNVDEVIITNHSPNDDNRSVCNELELIRKKYPDDKLVFANGGDRKEDDIPEYDFCEKNNVEMIFGAGGGKVQSSSWLIKKSSK